MSFVKFTEVGKTFAPQVRITPWGVISFNTGACKKYGIAEHSHCVMYLDPDAHTVAFEMVNDENLDGANPLRHLRYDGIDVNGRAFLNHFQLRLGQPMRFRLHHDPETHWLTLDLAHPDLPGRHVQYQPEHDGFKYPTPDSSGAPPARGLAGKSWGDKGAVFQT